MINSILSNFSKQFQNMVCHFRTLWICTETLALGTELRFSFFLNGQLSFSGMVRPLDEAHIHMSAKEVTVRAGLKVSVEADKDGSIVGYP
jgi:hypothetical protein